jgi:nucleoside-diphosphate-sugar epimerase
LYDAMQRWAISFERGHLNTCIIATKENPMTQTTTTEKIALVLGATGGIGGEVARQLGTAGWRVRALHRSPEKLEATGGIEWRRGDAMNAGDVLAAARGAAVIVHAVNPPGYQRWAELVLPMMDNTIAAARASGARIVLPGTVYNFGPDAFPELREESPQRPLTRKGAIRVEMERRLERAAGEGVRGLIVRAGDFFGPHAANNWFSQGLAKAGVPLSTIRNPGRAGVGHQWAYLPDVAATMVKLLERGSTAAFERFHMDGHWDASGRDMADAIQRVVARETGRRPRIAAFPWWLVTLASPVVAVFGEMREMRYLWQQPLRMSNARLLAAIGSEPHTPLDDAVRATLLGQGVLRPLPETATRVREGRAG